VDGAEIQLPRRLHVEKVVEVRQENAIV